MSLRLEIIDHQIRLSNEKVLLIYETSQGWFSLYDREERNSYFTRAFVRVITAKQVFDSRMMIFKRVNSIDFTNEMGVGKTVVITLQSVEHDIEIHIRFSMVANFEGFLCMAQLKNRSGTRINVHSIDVFAIEIDHEHRIFLGNQNPIWFFRNGYHSWELSQSILLDSDVNISHFFSVLTNAETKRSFVLGFVTMSKQSSTIAAICQADENGTKFTELKATCLLDSIPLLDRETVMSEELLLLVGKQAQGLLSKYVNLVGQKMKAITWPNIPTGWCSWYFYYTMPDEMEILANAQKLSERFPEVEWVQLDDGYQKSVGDWTENERFPNGLKWLVDRIKETGFKAGIWTAPFIASEHSELFKTKQEWFIRDEKNQPLVVGENPLWLGKYYALDLSNPKVIEFISNLFKRLKNFGFEYFKIDFLYHATQNGMRYNPKVTTTEALRKGLETIREAVGDALILGCGAPLGPCVGIVNMMRIGTDIASAWRYDWGGGVYECAINTMTRSILHNKWWVNDPDCILVRQDDNELTIEEIKLWLTVVALSGGAVLLSDRMMETAEERFRLVDKILPPYGKGAIAIDALTSTEPKIFALKIESPIGQWAVVAVINLSEKEIDVRFPLKDVGLEDTKPHHVFEFWNEEYEGTIEEELFVRKLKPHSCKLYAIRPEVEIPTILSTSIHFTQGAMELRNLSWNERTNTLSVNIAQDTRNEDAIFFVTGPMWQPVKGFIDEKPVRLHKIAPEVVAIRGKFRKGQELKILYEFVPSG